VLGDNGRPVPDTVVELVQANACGRYAHTYDQHDAPLDPNFTGVGRAITMQKAAIFVTVKPGAYPWANGANTWRPAHIHFSVFGPAFAARLVTQMYFPGDPLFPLDAIANSVPEYARHRIVCRFDLKPQCPIGRCLMCSICAARPRCDADGVLRRGRPDTLADHGAVLPFWPCLKGRRGLTAESMLGSRSDLTAPGMTCSSSTRTQPPSREGGED
jgi:protocatechuate 3,4-dioxygenase beta subunit